MDAFGQRALKKSAIHLVSASEGAKGRTFDRGETWQGSQKRTAD
jgi:hypothetical protein